MSKVTKAINQDVQPYQPWLAIEQSLNVPLLSPTLLWSHRKSHWSHRAWSTDPLGRLHPDDYHQCGGFFLKSLMGPLVQYFQDLEEGQDGVRGERMRPQTGLRKSVPVVESQRSTTE